MDELLELTNTWIVDPYILNTVASTKHASFAPWSEDYSMKRQFLVLWAFLYLNSMIVYVIFGTGTFVAFFLQKRKENLAESRIEHHSSVHGGLKAMLEHTENPAYWPWDATQIRDEMWVSTWSLFIMAGMTAVIDMYFLLGGSSLYNNISDYGWFYFFISPVLFLMFTDTLIYWIHRILHWPSVYWLHKLHHKYKETTPWSAFSFHPLDGFAQSVPYHIFACFFPMHSRLYLFTLFCVGMWTVNIHDRMTLRIPGVNGAAHHTIHHTKFNYNYGQYTTFWDQFFGTYKDPLAQWPYELDEAAIEREKVREKAELAEQRKQRAMAGLPKQVTPLEEEEEKEEQYKKEQ